MLMYIFDYNNHYYIKFQLINKDYHKNRFQKVIRIGGSIKTIYELKAQGILPLYTTHNHPFYVKTMDKIWSNKNRRYERVFSEAKWKETNNLQKNDFLGIPII